METALSYEKLVEFLYLLMRDAAPTGSIVEIVRIVARNDGTAPTPESPNTYTSKELQAYAERLAKELLGWSE